jgi:chorismate mutase
METESELKPFEPSGAALPQRPLLIAGPCSAESEEQVIETAIALKESGAHIFRAGIWKPRTRPASFQGIGERALPWLKSAREMTGMPIATEVATPRHAELALDYNLDVLWIGARTTANPFAVEEIARHLEGKDVPLLIKNPVNPELSLWIGAIERFLKRGVRQIAAVHRGFSCNGKNRYRNPPHWEIPLQLQKEIPGIPVIHDPSHTTGHSGMVIKTARKALQMHLDGLMVEVHPNPANALSDKKQQLSPGQFGEMIDKLNIRSDKENCSPVKDHEEMEVLRKKIDLLDRELLNIMERRMHISHEIGNFKKNHHIDPLQNKRWQRLISERVARGKAKGMSREFIRQLFDTIHRESLNVQKTMAHHQQE